MAKNRLQWGQPYWNITFKDDAFSIHNVVELRNEANDSNFETGNYFYTKEEAETMVMNIRELFIGRNELEEDGLIAMAKKEAEVYGMLFSDSSRRCQINRENGFYDGFICGYKKAKSIINGELNHGEYNK